MLRGTNSVHVTYNNIEYTAKMDVSWACQIEKYTDFSYDSGRFVLAESQLIDHASEGPIFIKDLTLVIAGDGKLISAEIPIWQKYIDERKPLIFYGKIPSSKDFTRIMDTIDKERAKREWVYLLFLDGKQYPVYPVISDTGKYSFYTDRKLPGIDKAETELSYKFGRENETKEKKDSAPSLYFLVNSKQPSTTLFDLVKKDSDKRKPKNRHRSYHSSFFVWTNKEQLDQIKKIREDHKIYFNQAFYSVFEQIKKNGGISKSVFKNTRHSSKTTGSDCKCWIYMDKKAYHQYSRFCKSNNFCLGEIGYIIISSFLNTVNKYGPFNPKLLKQYISETAEYISGYRDEPENTESALHDRLTKIAEQQNMTLDELLDSIGPKSESKESVRLLDSNSIDYPILVD